MSGTLSPELLQRMDAYWRAANHRSIGQIYPYDNPLLREPLRPEHIKPRLLGHWGTTPGQNFIYVHLNRVIKQYDLNVIYISGPGHGGPSLVANTYLEGTYSELYPNVSQDEEGMQRLFQQFSFPGGIPSPVAPETPGSIHEGGELGYSLAHAFGAVLPILHLNGYKIANPTILARIPREELEQLFRGYGYRPYFVEGDEPEPMHQLMAAALDEVMTEIQRIQSDARTNGFRGRPRWPMIVLRTPKGWTGPQVVDGQPVEGAFRSHQVPLAGVRSRPEHLKLLEDWMRSYRPQELFDEKGKLAPDLAQLPPQTQEGASGKCSLSRTAEP